jgi:polyketide cyclase/dehydrase/lipid transport protein
VSEFRRQAVIDAPLPVVWGLVGNPRRYPEWWPRVLDVRGERFQEGAEFVQVTRSPLGKVETTYLIDGLDELQQIRMHCTKSGTFADWSLTEAQSNTFVEVQFGLDPLGPWFRVYDRAIGRRFNRRWCEESLEALRRAATDSSPY